jgi:hypothetical protein
MGGRFPVVSIGDGRCFVRGETVLQHRQAWWARRRCHHLRCGEHTGQHVLKLVPKDYPHRRYLTIAIIITVIVVPVITV